MRGEICYEYKITIRRYFLFRNSCKLLLLILIEAVLRSHLIRRLVADSNIERRNRLLHLFLKDIAVSVIRLILLLFLLCLFFLHVKNLFCNLNFGFLIRWKHDIQNDSKQCCRYDS